MLKRILGVNELENINKINIAGIISKKSEVIGEWEFVTIKNISNSIYVDENLKGNFVINIFVNGELNLNEVISIKLVDTANKKHLDIADYTLFAKSDYMHINQKFVINAEITFQTIGEHHIIVKTKNNIIPESIIESFSVKY